MFFQLQLRFIYLFQASKPSKKLKMDEPMSETVSPKIDENKIESIKSQCNPETVNKVLKFFIHRTIRVVFILSCMFVLCRAAMAS